MDGARRLTYAYFARQATRAARALQASGLKPGERVAYLCANVAELLIAHFAVPLAGAVLVAINTRLAPEEVAYICNHSGARLLVADPDLASTLAPVRHELATIEDLFEIAPDSGTSAVSGRTYSDLLERGSDSELPWTVDDEDATISINYTSGTTGRPKGVMYSHRGAYLNALGEIIHSEHSPRSVYLWTLPMFHCNGWCTTWGVTAIGGRHVCLPAVRADVIWELLERERVSHLNGAPIVMTTIATAPQAKPLDWQLTATTAGAPPSPQTIAQLERIGARVIHVYGGTETYGPYALCEWQPSWDALDSARRARLLARQGVGMIQAEPLRVVDEAMRDVPCDGETMGEILMRGNNVMKGYFGDDAATAEAFRGGWFHSGDLGVMHPDGYVELRDRAKDVVISGGENISTVEVEHAFLSHDAVLEVAVVATPDERWGERPKAYVVLKPRQEVTEAQLLDHVRSRLARFKVPGRVEFVADLPKTSTGKLQKAELRQREWAGHASRIKG